MGSIMDSRYWTCPSCCTQFDWKDGSAEAHDQAVCEKRLQADAEFAAKPLRERLNEALTKTRSQKLSEAGFKRRPGVKSLPSDE